ncbi:uroporphyrinogen-III C-methyltransferase [Paenibacillus sp. CC-CFT747]|nr:uroporphyrinogen-III C-methyltransferase [Paenibacillus sp. CC-CFT747]
MAKGKVYLVGAGPGDPKLITVRGLEAIQKADAVVYDRLANPALLRHMKPGAEKIYVGKLPDRHTLKQEVINQLLVDLALEGKIVTRLKGGDPSVFGRVGEEAELVAENGIEFEIVPGITSAIAVPAYAGIPVTHRDFTSSLAIVTGHECPVKETSNIDWGKLSTATGTLIFLMGVSNIGSIRDVLLANGKPAATPVAVIRWGTRAEQRTLVGTLATIVEQVEEARFKSPAIIIVGEVVTLRDKLSWFERKPLFGQRVLVTRSRSQASELADRIDELGGEVVEFPVIRLQPPSRPEAVQALEEGLKRLSRYDWVIFTSVNGVEFFFDKLRERRLDIRLLSQAQIAAVGPKTAEALEKRGLFVDSQPDTFQAEDLLREIAPRLQAGERVLLPRGDLARSYLPEELRKLGQEVTEVDVYETVASTEGGEDVVRMLQDGDITAVTFTSSSTVTNFLAALAEAGGEELRAKLKELPAYCIGPVTAETAAAAGWTRIRVSEQATISSLVEALVSKEQ